MACTGDHNIDSVQTSKKSCSEIWKFDERLESDPDNCASIVNALLGQLDAFGWCNRDTFGIHMAMEEAIMNAIRHGNRCDSAKHVHIVMELCCSRFYSRITDQGSGFDPAKIPDPTLEENLEKTSGRGVMLMNKFVDRVTYNEVGNSVELEKTKSK